MPETYEVSAVLAIVDRASPQLERILALADKVTAAFERIKGLGKGLFVETGITAFAKQVDGLAPALARVAGSMDQVGAAATAGFDRVNAAMAATLDQARLLRTELAGVAAAAGGAALGGGGSGLGRGGGGGNLHGRISAPLGPMHVSGSVHDYGKLAGAVSLGFGFEQDLKTRDALTRAILTSGVKLSSDDFASTEAQLEKIVGSVASDTGMLPSTIASAMPAIVRQMSGFKLSERMAVMPKILHFAALESYFKGVPLEEGAESMIGLMHQSNKYSPAAINALAKSVFTASLVSPLNLEQINRAAAYSLPTLSKLQGLNPDDLLLYSAFMQRAGMISTRSGTAQLAFYQSLMPGTKGGNLLTSGAHGAALKALGLLDAAGKPTFLDAQGRVSTTTVVAQVDAALAQMQKTMTPAQFTEAKTSDFYHAFGTRGERYAALLFSPQFTSQMPGLRQLMQTMPGEHAMLQQYGDNSPLQTSRKALSQFALAMMDLTNVVLPAFTQSVKGITGILSIADKVVKSTGIPDAGSVTSWGTVLGGAYLLSSKFRGLVKGGAAIAGRGLGIGGGAGLGLLGTAGAVAGLGLLDYNVGRNFLSSTGAPWWTLIPGGEMFWHPQAPGAKGAAPDHANSAGIVSTLADAIKSALQGSSVVMDGQVVGQIVTDHQAKDAHKPPSTASHFDSRLSPLFPTTAE